MTKPLTIAAPLSLTARLKYLRDWWPKHGSSLYENADEWINSFTNVELIEQLAWPEEDETP